MVSIAINGLKRLALVIFPSPQRKYVIDNNCILIYILSMDKGEFELFDGAGRRVSYLRLSITDRCNLNCIYCCPKKRISILKHQDVLRFEEIMKILNLLTKKGVNKVRLTGGEPLLRRNVLDLCSSIRKLEGIKVFSLTTNGVLLKDVISDLVSIGIDGINISLDSLRRERFRDITGVDALPRVLEGLESALKLNVSPLKINVVLMGGVNDDEVDDFINLAREEPIDVRFIEYMPLIKPSVKIDFLSSKFVISRIKYFLRRLSENGSTSKLYEIPGFKGRIGFISPVSESFCSSCSRIRLTADGRLRACLMSEKEIDLKTPLRNGCSNKFMVELIKTFLLNKTFENGVGKKFSNEVIMSSIGG